MKNIVMPDFSFKYSLRCFTGIFLRALLLENYIHDIGNISNNSKFVLFSDDTNMFNYKDSDK